MRKYRLVSKKGEGTFSEVLKAQNVKRGTYHAIKVSSLILNTYSLSYRFILCKSIFFNILFFYHFIAYPKIYFLDPIEIQQTNTTKNILLTTQNFETLQQH